MTTTWGPIGYEVYERTYKRPEDADWRATVERVVDGNLSLVDEKHIEPGERQALIDAFLDFKILPAGRHLWASGAQTTLGLFNCHRAGWGPSLSSHFTFTFDQLMLGGGVGANYSQEYLNKLPRIQNEVKLDINCRSDHPDLHEFSQHVTSLPAGTTVLVDDSREGWVYALALVIEAHTNGLDHFAIDVSNVRERGREIRGFGGTASGPGPLVEMLVNVNKILNEDTGFLNPKRAMEIDHAIASCVIAGNVRRSARMSIVHWNDPMIEWFLNCKADGTSHWSTNISVEVDWLFWEEVERGGTHANRVLDRIVEGMLRDGEPGIFNSTLASEGEVADVRSTNPCGEIALEEWEQCCLGHVNLAAFAEGDDWVEAAEAFRLMGRFLYRATFAAASDPKQAMVKQANRRIGVGFFGFQDYCVKRGVKYSDAGADLSVAWFLRAMRNHVQEQVARYADSMGESRPIKYTTVAPTGTIAKMPGTSEGAHPIYARYFIRRVRYSADDPRLAGLAAQDHPIEDCIYSSNTKVVSYYCRDALLDHAPEHLIEGQSEIPVRDQLKVQAMIQTYYADNAVSYTVNVDPSSVPSEALRATLRDFGPRLKGTTVFPAQSRAQAPVEALTASEYRRYSGAHEVSQSFDDCATGACPVR